ncbi:UNVERIFIED_CONTAM: hypothetical protein K2H54_032772 [Gekko kuhli]
MGFLIGLDLIKKYVTIHRRQVESNEAPKDTASAPKCPPPAHDTSPMEQVPNGDAEMGSPENSSTTDLKGRQCSENESSSLPDGEMGRALENGRCTPKDSPDPPASEGELGGYSGSGLLQ